MISLIKLISPHILLCLANLFYLLRSHELNRNRSNTSFFQDKQRIFSYLEPIECMDLLHWGGLIHREDHIDHQPDQLFKHLFWHHSIAFL